jgi:hypothetical protein
MGVEVGEKAASGFAARGCRSRSQPGGGENLGGAGRQEGMIAAGFRPAAKRLLRWERSSGAERLAPRPHGRAGRAQRQESRGLERGADHRGGEGPEDENPTGVTGMKQARAELRGVSRRGREKRRGRTVAGVAGPRGPDPQLFDAPKGSKALEGAVRPRGRRRSSGRALEGRVRLREAWPASTDADPRCEWEYRAAAETVPRDRPTSTVDTARADPLEARATPRGSVRRPRGRPVRKGGSGRAGGRLGP